MKILVIHHVETMWESGYKMYGTSIDEVVENLYNYLEENDYDRVILTRFEDTELEPETYILSEFVDVVYDYAYGWDEDCFLGDVPEDYKEGGTHSELVWIPEWLKDIANAQVDLCGAFVGECLEDMELAMNHCGIKPNLINSLCVG